MNGLKLIIANDADDLAKKAAEHFAEKSAAAQGRFVVALSGGSTPRRFHGHLAAHMRQSVDWAKVHVLLSDERALPPTDPNSNFHMVQQTLAKPLGLEPSQLYRPAADAEDLDSAAQAYENIISGLTAPPGAIDLVVLGMGDDGHTASLFPGKPEPAGLVAAVDATEGTVAARRLTFTFEALGHARALMILVSGSKKASRLREVLTEDGSLPMQRVLQRRKDGTTLIADRDALSQLDPSQIEELQ